MSRRHVLKGVLAAGAGLGLSSSMPTEATEPTYKVKNGRINQSVVSWCFKPMSVDELAGHVVALGMPSLELVTPEYFQSSKNTTSPARLRAAMVLPKFRSPRRTRGVH